MSVITEEMAIEYHKSSLYKEYIEQLQISEKNEGDEFMKSLRCSNIYVPDIREVTEKYRKQAVEQGIDSAWIDRYMPLISEKDIHENN